MSIHAEIYVAGMAAVYAGARDLGEFWETVLARRCGFREFPQRRLQLNEYGSERRDERDKTYVKRAALIEGFEFDWKAQRVPKAAFEATDPTHWLALTTAIRAIEESGVDLDAVGRDRVGVILGNSLTGEVTRANLLRLRWPYVRRAIADGAARVGLGDSALAALVREVEQSFKGAFPVPNEDTLAGALSNVIAGRICNVLDLNGGGYVVDGACASSLLAVSAACEALAARRLDMVIAGGVDISLDPLELVGFARIGAFTTGPMRVYDKDSAGFLPGEGCGLVVLMRGQDMERHGLRSWARIAGWGISSDGSGGITAPKATGQALAMRRCYERADFGAADLDFIEGHGTGTAVGDPEELGGFLEITAGDEGSDLRRTGVTSVKTLVGHTKAAAGAAGLIKAVLGVNQRVRAPLAGLRTPADAFGTPGARIYPIAEGDCLPPETGLKAGVSGAGFGGINCHIAVTSEGIPKRNMETRDAEMLLASAQDAELFVASADDLSGLLARVKGLLHLSTGMAEGELVDLAAAGALRDRAGPWRVAVVAETVDQLQVRLASLVDALEGAGDEVPATPPGTLVGRANPALRIGYLIPGQGSQFVGMGGTLVKRAGWAATRRARWDARFADLGPRGLSGFIERPVERADGPEVIAGWATALRDTRVAQPAIVMTSLQWIQWLRQVGITPSAVVGHSLGEITAMVAARVLSEVEAIDMVRVRARECAGEAVPSGSMLALKCGLETAQGMVAEGAGYAVVANDNASDQVVAAGEPRAIAALAQRSDERGVEAVILNVSKAFHTKHMASVADALGRMAAIQGEERDAGVPIFSGVSGGPAPTRFDPYRYAASQITAPVRFREAVVSMAGACDILVEVGPGSVLTGLARRSLGKRLPICALEPGGTGGDARFCTTIGQLFVSGALFDWETFYAERYWRPFVPASERKFIENPCALGGSVDPGLIEAAEIGTPGEQASAPEARTRTPEPSAVGAAGAAGAPIEDILRELVARETGYDLEMISPDASLARDLNLDSIKISEVRAELGTRGIDLPEELTIGPMPIRDIAAVAVRRQTQDQAGVEAPPSVTTVPMPKDLPVLGYLRTWEDTELVPSSPPIGRALILCAPDRAAEAGRLAERLRAAGVQARIDDNAQAPDSPDGGQARLIVLPGTRAAVDAVSALFARLGALLGAEPGARPGSVLLVSGPGFAPVFGVAQSLSLELPELPVLAVEAATTADIHQVACARIDPGARLLRIGADGSRGRMRLDRWEPPAAPAIPLQAGDLLMVSGGGKGITAECTIALLRATGARALLLGTSPEEAPGAEVEGTLRRITDARLEAFYLQCDVTDAASVNAALQRARDRIGAFEIAGLVQGAGVNSPTPVTQLDRAVLKQEYSVKVTGLTNLLAAVDVERLKLCIAFGSVIGAVGMRGNSGYALANEAMAEVLLELKAAHPRIQVACPAFSVWSEVGMGAKLDVLATLERQKVAAIPIAAGTRWFLTCCGQPEVPIPLIVAAPMHGLPTWRRALGTDVASGLPYVDDRVVHEPGVALVSRPSLNPERDTWLIDHDFRGSLLFATVEALRAIGAGARLLAGGGVVTRFQGLVIARAIVAAHQGDTTIELDVRRGETDEWSGSIGAPGTAKAHPAFSARCRVGAPEADARGPANALFDRPGETGTDWKPVPTEVGVHLYASILFQGSRFQRIERVHGLDLSDDVRRRGRFGARRERSETDAAVPDTCFLDAMLQSVQVLVPKDSCLPTGIDEVVFYPAAWEAGATTLEAEITERTPTGYIARVRAWNTDGGAPVARYEGYRTDILEHREMHADAHALFDPMASDASALEHWLAGHADRPELEVALGPVDDSHQETRRAAAASQIASELKVAASALTWEADGKPRLVDRPELDVSIAHDAGRLLTVCGDGRVGCDLQRIVSDRRLWGELLPTYRTQLWRELAAAIHDGDRAGTIVWAIHEALVKAGAADAEVTLLDIGDDGPRFRLDGGRVVAGIIDLVLAGPSAIALAQLTGRAEDARITHYTRPLEMTFKEVLPPLKSPTASVFFTWMGTLREEAMSDIRSELAHAFDQGGKGMVTNGTWVRIERPIQFSTPLRVWVWLERVLSTHPSTFELGFQWARTGLDGTPHRILAQGAQRLTWVAVGPAGHVTVEPFPAFFADFIARRSPGPDAGTFTPPLGHLPEEPMEEAIHWRRQDSKGPGSGDEHGAARLRLETDETHANYVGNIYFSHAATLAERACRRALHEMGTGPGGLFATAFRLDHLGEAMPGDTLEAIARLSVVGAKSCAFDIALLNQTKGGEKIATGQARYRLFASAAEDAEPLEIGSRIKT